MILHTPKSLSYTLTMSLRRWSPGANWRAVLVMNWLMRRFWNPLTTIVSMRPWLCSHVRRRAALSTFSFRSLPAPPVAGAGSAGLVSPPAVGFMSPGLVSPAGASGFFSSFFFLQPMPARARASTANSMIFGKRIRLLLVCVRRPLQSTEPDFLSMQSKLEVGKSKLAFRILYSLSLTGT